MTNVIKAISYVAQLPIAYARYRFTRDEQHSDEFVHRQGGHLNAFVIPGSIGDHSSRIIRRQIAIQRFSLSALRPSGEYDLYTVRQTYPCDPELDKFPLRLVASEVANHREVFHDIMQKTPGLLHRDVYRPPWQRLMGFASQKAALVSRLLSPSA